MLVKLLSFFYLKKNISHFLSFFFFPQRWDFLFIYDGPNITSPLIGAFSGLTLPEPIISTSNALMITFSSDLHLTYSGFYISYIASPCPFNCSSHGVCNSNSECICSQGFTGDYCQYLSCPSNCSGNGICSSEQNKCICNEGFIGTLLILFFSFLFFFLIRYYNYN